MTGFTGRTLLASTAMILALSACEEGELFAPTTAADSTGEDGAPVATSAGARTEVREVERADVFSVTEAGLWDGRPSLGGVWVAHPDATTPERVRIQNTSSGAVVNGALFLRERENPGPRIQVSSDAAAALGMLAGAPAELSVVVLRQEEVEIAPILAPAAADAADDGTELASADVSDIEAGEDGTVLPAAMATADAAPKPKRKGFFAALFGSGPTQSEPIETEVVAEGGDVVTTTAAAPAVETASLDTIAAASAAIDEAEAATPAPARPTNNALQNPFVQVGLFSVEANAEAAATSLRQAGIVPTVSAGSNGDRQFWRVMVGPMTGATEQAAMLKQVRDLGYSDAFLAPS